MNHCDVFDYKVNTVYGAQKHLLERHTGIRGRKPTGNLVLAPLPLHTIQGTLHVLFLQIKCQQTFSIKTKRKKNIYIYIYMEKEMATHSSIFAWRSHGQRSLVGYCSWGHKELGITE